MNKEFLYLEYRKLNPGYGLTRGMAEKLCRDKDIAEYFERTCFEMIYEDMKRKGIWKTSSR